MHMAEALATPMRNASSSGLPAAKPQASAATMASPAPTVERTSMGSGGGEERLVRAGDQRAIPAQGNGDHRDAFGDERPRRVAHGGHAVERAPRKRFQLRAIGL